MSADPRLRYQNELSRLAPAVQHAITTYIDTLVKPQASQPSDTNDTPEVTAVAGEVVKGLKELIADTNATSMRKHHGNHGS